MRTCRDGRAGWSQDPLGRGLRCTSHTALPWPGSHPGTLLLLALEPQGRGRATVGYISRPCDRRSVVENCRTFWVGPPCLYLRNWGGIELGWPWLTEGTSFLPGKCSLVLNHLPLCLRPGSVSQATWGRERAAGDKDGQCHVY